MRLKMFRTLACVALGAMILVGTSCTIADFQKIAPIVMAVAPTCVEVKATADLVCSVKEEGKGQDKCFKNAVIASAACVIARARAVQVIDAVDQLPVE